jgi:hypothetical protein
MPPELEWGGLVKRCPAFTDEEETGYAFGENVLRAEDGQGSEGTLAFKLEPLTRLSS